ncbi:hypothetical protein BUALT_Bualt16G0007700 [Buddleja alternifolia]|uniref:Uncharacterized protein n=1 Tax=Buddleja alternifolia TaxID=168488 RepID=A0AAV6WEK5_9LAMI|nr:hypothetical protein BUALT_Bualt16G0007700 [Buddleja alternifolia]
MALLSSCWLIIEFYLIPDGFAKWYSLSFYIHPFFLFFCQIFLWLKKLQIWFLLLFFFPFRIVHFFISLFISLFSLVIPKTKNIELFYDAMDHGITQDSDQFVGNGSRFQSRMVLEMGNSSKVDIWFDAHEGVIPKSSQSDSISQYNHNHVCTMDNVQVIIPDPECTFRSCQSDLTSHKQFDIVSEFPHSKFQKLLRMTPSEAEEEMDQKNYCRDSWLDEYLSSDHYSSSLMTYDNDQEFIDDVEDSDIGSSYSFSTVDHDHDHEYLPTFCGSNSPMGALEQVYLIRRSEEEDIDTFHQKYTERMRFFDTLYHERLYGLTSISNEHLTSPILFRRVDSSIDFSMQYTSWSKMVRKRVLRSLEHDFELIYVAQTCLLWEALHHQYKKVEALMLSNNSGNRIFNSNISGKFQECQILLERFVEDLKCEGQESSNCTHKTISFQSLLQVPEVTGFMEQQNSSMGGEAIRATEVLKAIWKCIKAFWLFVNIDKKKSLWKYKGILRSHPPVEDPKDLELLHQVTKELHKKIILLKDLQGKKKCWQRKVKSLQAEDEKRNVLFSKIDMKLVQMLLKMSMISTSHLNWCKEKLNNLEFRKGEIFRVHTNHLFPSS